MVMVPVCGWLHNGVPDVAALTSVKVVVALYVFVIVAVPDAFRTIVWLPAMPLTVYVTTAFGVPVNVTVALFPAQMVTFVESETVGGGKTVIVTVPV
jgi:hypothetical protein